MGFLVAIPALAVACICAAAAVWAHCHPPSWRFPDPARRSQFMRPQSRNPFPFTLSRDQLTIGMVLGVVAGLAVAAFDVIPFG
jgi:hypothetical protein